MYSTSPGPTTASYPKAFLNLGNLSKSGFSKSTYNTQKMQLGISVSTCIYYKILKAVTKTLAMQETTTIDWCLLITALAIIKGFTWTLNHLMFYNVLSLMHESFYRNNL